MSKYRLAEKSHSFIQLFKHSNIQKLRLNPQYTNHPRPQNACQKSIKRILLPREFSRSTTKKATFWNTLLAIEENYTLKYTKHKPNLHTMGYTYELGAGRMKIFYNGRFIREAPLRIDAFPYASWSPDQEVKYHQAIQGKFDMNEYVNDPSFRTP